MCIEAHAQNHDLKQERTTPIELLFYGIIYNETHPDPYRSITSQAIRGIEQANDSYVYNRLPLELNLVGTDLVTNYVEVNMATDRANLLNVSNPFFKRTHAVAEELNADVVILFTYNKDVDKDVCGWASSILASDPSTSVAVVKADCVKGQTFTHEIGHLQGARHEYQEDSNTKPFAYGHGYGVASVANRTIMAYYCYTEVDIPVNCGREKTWSDPHRVFFGSTVPAGTEDVNWNAKVLFVTGPYIASLRGDEQNYDSISPTGLVSISVEQIISFVPVNIYAIFNEEIHPDYPPHLTITDSKTSKTFEMKRIDGTTFTIP